MDIHILRLREHTAAKYAIGHAKGDDFGAFLDSIGEWAGNLRAQGYTRVVSVVISFQWNDPAAGPPWERVDESPPPRRPAGKEIEATFRAQRQQVPTNSWLSRAGPIALLDARVLGSNIAAKTKATALGRALSIEHHLSPLEKEILERLETKLPTESLGMDDPAVRAAVRSLIQNQLIQ